MGNTPFDNTKQMRKPAMRNEHKTITLQRSKGALNYLSIG